MISRSGATAGATIALRSLTPRPAAEGRSRPRLPWYLMLAASLTVTACGGPWDSGGITPSTVNVANAALSAGLYDLALNVSNAILARYPRDAGALAAKGDALLGTGNAVGAEQVYQSLLAIDPNSVRGMTGLGRVQLQSDPARAEATFLRVLQRDPRNVVALNDLGVARDLQGRHADAQEAYRTALGVAPDNIEAKVNMGLSLALSGHAADAVGMLRPLAATPGAPDRIRNDLALAESLSGQPADTGRAFAARTPANAPAGSGPARIAEAALPPPYPPASGALATTQPDAAQRPAANQPGARPAAQQASVLPHAAAQAASAAAQSASGAVQSAAQSASGAAQPMAQSASAVAQSAAPPASARAQATAQRASVPGATGAAGVLPARPDVVPELTAALHAAESGCPLAWPAPARAAPRVAPTSAANLAGWPIAGVCGGASWMPWPLVEPEPPLAATTAVSALTAVGTELPPAEGQPSGQPVVAVLLPWPEQLVAIGQDPARARAVAADIAAPIAYLPSLTRYATVPSSFLQPDETGAAVSPREQLMVGSGDAWPFEDTSRLAGARIAPSVPAVAPLALTALATTAGVPDEGLTVAAVPTVAADVLEAAANGQLGEPAATVVLVRGRGAGAPRPVAAAVSAAPPNPVSAAVPTAVSAAPPIAAPAAVPIGAPDAVRAPAPLAQVASLDSEAAARAAWAQLQARMPDVLAGHAPLIVPADVGGRQYWRLRTGGFASLDDAKAFCGQVTAAGGACWIALVSD